MSYVRVMVFENQMPWTEGMKNFRKAAEPGLKALKKQKILSNYSLVQTGDHSGMLIAEFDNKAKMNKYVKMLSAVRREVEAETGQQSWIYNGPVKAGG